MYERDKGEMIVVIFDILATELTLTGTEPTLCQMKKAGPNGQAQAGAPVALTLPGTYTAAAGPDPANFTFSASSAALAAGTYVYGAFVFVGGEPVSLSGGQIRINPAVPELP